MKETANPEMRELFLAYEKRRRKQIITRHNRIKEVLGYLLKDEFVKKRRSILHLILRKREEGCGVL